MTKARPTDSEVRRRRITPVDVGVGKALRQRRVALGLTLDELARELGLSAQQVHKYETAQTRVPAARLNMFSRFLRLPLAEFFPDVPDTGSTSDEGVTDLQAGVMRLLKTLARPSDQHLVLTVVRTLVAGLAARHVATDHGGSRSFDAMAGSPLRHEPATRAVPTKAAAKPEMLRKRSSGNTP